MTPQAHLAVAFVERKKDDQLRLKHRGGSFLLSLQQTAVF